MAASRRRCGKSLSGLGRRCELAISCAARPPAPLIFIEGSLHGRTAHGRTHASGLAAVFVESSG